MNIFVSLKMKVFNQRRGFRLIQTINRMDMFLFMGGYLIY